MAFALRTGVAPSVLPRGQSRRQMVCRAGKFDEELMKTAVSSWAGLLQGVRWGDEGNQEQKVRERGPVQPCPLLQPAHAFTSFASACSSCVCTRTRTSWGRFSALLPFLLLFCAPSASVLQP